MAIGRVTEITSSSQDSFQAAIEAAVERAVQTLPNVRSAWVKEQSVEIEGGRISEYRVNVLVTSLDD